MVAVSSILHFIRRGRVIAVQALGDGEAAEALEFEAQLASDAVGVPLQELNLPKGALIAALVREESVLIPGGQTVIKEGDHVVVLSRQEAVHPVERLLQRRVDRD
jgi:trk system potassium uptake protein TrkA